ncbi:MAG: polysaccharide deacetylase family protein [Verrucomicrobiota bacterium]
MKALKQLFQRKRTLTSFFLHSVRENPTFLDLGPDIFLQPSTFRYLLEQISQFESVPLDRLTNAENLQHTRQRMCTLSFDDGYQDNLTTALPLLEQHSVPATIFVTSGFIDRKVLPYELVVAAEISRRDEIELSNDGSSTTVHIDSIEKKEQVYRQVTNQLKPASYDERSRFLDNICPDQDIIDSVQNLFLTWDEVRELHQHPLISIGVHTYSHLALSKQPAAIVRNEINRDMQRLESELQAPASTFAFPYGATSRACQKIASKCGLATFTTKYQPAVDSRKRTVFPRCEVKSVDDVNRTIQQTS